MVSVRVSFRIRVRVRGWGRGIFSVRLGSGLGFG